MSPDEKLADGVLLKRDQFATTHWSNLLAACGDDSPQAEAALCRLCHTYWYPIYAFLRRQGAGHEEAQDLTQSFFVRLLERRDLGRVRQEKGRFRSYLLTALKHFTLNERRHAHAEKRGGWSAFVPLDEVAEERYQCEQPDEFGADCGFDRRWALSLLEQVLNRIGQEYAASGRARLFDRLKDLLSGEPRGPSQAEVASELGMSENALKQAFHRFRARYQRLLREEIAQTVPGPQEIEDELRHLVAVLRS